MKLTTTLLTLVLAGGALAQTTTSDSTTAAATAATGSTTATSASGGGVVSIFYPEFSIFGPFGASIAGTGADGTTFVLTAETTPLTVTLVEDSTHVSETGDLPTGPGTAHIVIECGLAGGAAVCTENLELNGQSTQLGLTTAVELQTVSVLGGSIPVATSTTSSESVLGPTVSVSQTSTSASTATVVSGSGTGTTTATGGGQSSAAEAFNGPMIPVVAAAVMAMAVGSFVM